MKKCVTSIINIVIIAFLHYMVLQYLTQSVIGLAVWGIVLAGMVFLLGGKVVTGAAGVIFYYFLFSVFWYPRFSADESVHILKDLTLIVVMSYLITFLVAFLIFKFGLKKSR